MPDHIEASVDLLPLDAAHKALATRAVRLVDAAPKAFHDAADWLSEEYSEKAVAARKEADWRRGLEHKLRRLEDVVGPAEVQSRLTGLSCCRDTAWHDNAQGKLIFDKDRAAKVEAEARAVDAKAFAFLKRKRKADIDRVKAELAAGAEADRVERLKTALAYLAQEEFPADDERFIFARKVIFVAAVCVWADGFPGMGELAQWKWTGRSSVIDLQLDDGETPDGDPEHGREQVLFPQMKHGIILRGDEASFDGGFTDRLGKAVGLLESEQGKVGAGKVAQGEQPAEQGKLDHIATACLLVARNPGWTNQQIATEAGCSDRTLRRDQTFKRTAKVARGKAPLRPVTVDDDE